MVQEMTLSCSTRSTERSPDDLAPLAVSLCCRRTGVGADGVLVIRRSNGAIGMQCWNADGSRAEACGNGLRVVTRALFGRENVTTIHTDAGPVPVESFQRADGEFNAKTLLGPVTLADPMTLTIHGEEYCGVPVNVGNPHLVFPMAEFSGSDPVRQLGPSIEVSMPGRVNVGFYTVDSPRRVHLRVWERGCGETLACGTGAAAAVKVLQEMGIVEQSVEVQMPGGTLEVRSVASGPDHARNLWPGKDQLFGNHLRR